MKRLSALCLLLAGLNGYTHAQPFHLKGSVSDATGQPLAVATVRLLNAVDSSLAKIELTEESGNFEFTIVKPGAYRIGISLIGYESFSGAPIDVNNDLALPQIQLNAAATQLKEVAIVAQKPFVERRTDRTVLNVENSILATGNSALDILERAPGVVVNQNDAIALRGRSGVIVMIDGKPNPMSGADLANFLEKPAQCHHCV